jgi:hypothetical protein
VHCAVNTSKSESFSSRCTSLIARMMYCDEETAGTGSGGAGVRGTGMLASFVCL